MEKLVKDATNSTPKIFFDPENNKLQIEGESYPENSFEFYDPIFEWLEDYIEEVDNEEINVDFSIEYLNTSSTKSIMFILDILEEAYIQGKKININWYYESDNELSYEMAEDFMDYLELPFNLISK
ncbi:MAG: DUF1987 domain-containing protein [Fusobacteriota bacterium]